MLAGAGTRCCRYEKGSLMNSLNYLVGQQVIHIYSHSIQ
nr:hypothetical protein [Klebsiella pneumoniae]QLG01002.1 hypothetical protein [Enterobacter cloacae]